MTSGGSSKSGKNVPPIAELSSIVRDLEERKKTRMETTLGLKKLREKRKLKQSENEEKRIANETTRLALEEASQQLQRDQQVRMQEQQNQVMMALLQQLKNGNK